MSNSAYDVFLDKCLEEYYEENEDYDYSEEYDYDYESDYDKYYDWDDTQ